MLEECGVKFYLSAGVKELVGEEGKVRAAGGGGGKGRAAG